jgi:hypothetical protein
MSEHSGSEDGNDEMSIEDQQENQVGAGDDYSSDKGIEEEHMPKITNEKKITIEQVFLENYTYKIKKMIYFRMKKIKVLPPMYFMMKIIL